MPINRPNPVPAPDFEQLYAELAVLPDNLTGEIINNQLHTSPRPAGPHGIAASVLGADVLQAYHRWRGGPGGWWIIDEPELHLSLSMRQVLVPDIAGWRRECLPRIPTDHRFTLAPDWVCEVLSTDNLRRDRHEKMPIYAKAGVSHLWLVDPLNRTLETFCLLDGHWTLTGNCANDDSVRAPPFEAVSLELQALWVPDQEAPDWG